MRRADRLFQTVQMLRRGKVLTAQAIARELEVSPRTVYRDIQDLIQSGVPVEGEAGVGYCLHRGFDLPPLMFDEGEIKALVLGARMVQAFADPHLAKSARSLLDKIETVVPERMRESFEQPELQVPAGLCPSLLENMQVVRDAIDARRRLHFRYTDQDGKDSERTVQPLVLAFWGMVWTLGAWCELREDFRTFRLDRLDGVEVLDEFPPDEQRSLAVFVRQIEQQLEARGWSDPWRERNRR